MKLIFKMIGLEMKLIFKMILSSFDSTGGLL